MLLTPCGKKCFYYLPSVLPRAQGCVLGPFSTLKFKMSHFWLQLDIVPRNLCRFLALTPYHKEFKVELLWLVFVCHPSCLNFFYKWHPPELLAQILKDNFTRSSSFIRPSTKIAQTVPLYLTNHLTSHQSWKIFEQHLHLNWCAKFKIIPCKCSTLGPLPKLPK